MVDSINDLWSTLSRKIIACVLIDDGAVIPVMGIVKHNIDLFAPKERPIWRGVAECVKNNTPPTVEAVTLRVNGDTPPGYIQHVASLFNEDDNRRLVYNTEQLKQVATLVKLQEIGKVLSGVKSVDDIDKAVDQANTDLRGLYAEKNTRIPDAEAVDAAAWQQVEQFSELVIPTGLGWFDRLSGGLWPGMNYWIVAAYKNRKTTIMRNMMLKAAQSGYPVAAYCAEGTRELFTIDCQVMLATQILYDKYGPERREELRLSKLLVLQNWHKQNREKPIFTKDEYEALQEARRIWRTLPIRVYDTIDGIRHLTTLHYDIKRDKLESGTVAVYLDYSQLFGQGKTLFDQQSNTAKTIQEIAQNEGVALVILAQRNEESVKGGSSYSPGVKGGGDAPAAADFLFIPQVDLENSWLLKVELTHSRHTVTGKGAHQINPSSGLILKEVEMKKRGLD